MSLIIQEYEQKGLDYFILRTARHYSYEMNLVFFEQIELPEARYILDVDSGNLTYQTDKL